MNAVPVYLLTGCLGAGKTTALNRLLADLAANAPPSNGSASETRAAAARRVGVLVNEFGRLGLDGKLIAAGAHPVYEVNRGNLFCTCVEKDGLAAFAALAARNLEMVLVETTGLAEPGDIDAWFDRPPIAGRFRAAANVCLVDAENFTKVAAFLPAAVNQVEAADALVINKIDRVPPEARPRLAAFLRDLNPRAEQTLVERAAIDWRLVGGLTHRRTHTPQAERPPRAIVAWSCGVTEADESRLRMAIASLGERLLRLKAGLDLGRGPMLVEAVFGRVSVRPLPPGSPPLGLTAIGHEIDEATLRRTFQAAFAIGLPLCG